MASKKKEKGGNKKSAPTGFATNRGRLTVVSRVLALLLGIIMVVFMLLSSSIYLFN